MMRFRLTIPLSEVFFFLSLWFAYRVLLFGAGIQSENCCLVVLYPHTLV